MNEVQLLLASPVTLFLLVAIIVTSLLAFQNARIKEALIDDVTYVRRRKQYYRWVTSAFIHGGPIHLFFNVLTLYFMGPFLEYQIGSVAFAAIYFLSLLAGSGWEFVNHFRDPGHRGLGASGAIAGITTAAALFAPLSTVLVFFVPMPFILYAVAFIFLSALAADANVLRRLGHTAHLGGALMGLALVCILYPQVARDAYDTVVNAITSG